MFYAQYASIVVWKSQNGAETLVNLGARKKLTCFDPLRKGCGDFFYFFCSQLLVQHTIPTTLNSHKNNFNEIILFQNSPVQPLPFECLHGILRVAIAGILFAIVDDASHLHDLLRVR